jgi:predicted nucleotide-binding protein (sugar kinase/HSP70/actin superfamily)
MGNVKYFLTDLFERLEINYFPPPPTSRKTVALGTRYAPEFACFPFKVTLGNFIEALEAGADTLVMVGGIGPCRFGYYAETQRRILESLGYHFEMVIIEPPLAHPLLFYRALRKLCPSLGLLKVTREIKTSFLKAQSYDLLEKKALEVRPLEKRKGETDKKLAQIFKDLSQARTEEEIKRVREKGLRELEREKKEEKAGLKVGLIGEFYLVLEPFVNFEIEKFLNQKGVYVERGVYVTDWIGPSSKNPVLGISNEEIAQAALPYLSHFVGGEGRSTVGHVVAMTREEFDGIIHLTPFTCMPELVAKSTFPKIQNELDMPILSLVIDEHTEKTGFLTRVEAFLDLLAWRKNRGIKPRSTAVNWLSKEIEEKLATYGFKRR